MDRAILTGGRAGVFGLGFGAPGQEDFFFAYALKNKALHWAASKWFSAPRRSNGNISYVSMNHFEAATATKQQKGIATKETLLPTKSLIGIHPDKGGGLGLLGESPGVKSGRPCPNQGNFSSEVKSTGLPKTHPQRHHLPWLLGVGQ